MPQINCDEEDHRKFKMLAAREGMTMKQLMKKILETFEVKKK